MTKDKETNTSSNSKTQTNIKKSATMKIKHGDIQPHNFHKSLGFRKNDNKNISIKMNNSIIDSNKKIDNKSIHTNSSVNNTKLLYDKIKKKTYSNNYKKSSYYNYEYLKRSDKRNYKFGIKKRESLVGINKYNNYPKKRKNTVKNNNNNNINNFELKFNDNYSNRRNKKDDERRYSINSAHRPILSLDDIAASYNKMKEKRNKIINKFKGEKISPRQQSLYILATSPVLRLCEQIIFSHASENLKKVLSIDNILKNHNIFLNAKANELQNEICLCEKRINTPFVASKIADITLNFIQNRDEIDFMTLSDNYGENNDEMKDYYNYVKLLFILFNESYDDIIYKKQLIKILFEKIKNKGFNCIRDYLYHIYIGKKEEVNIITKIDIINNEILKESPNLLSLHETIKMSKFICFSKYLVKEIILYANNINDMFELKYRAQNLLEIVYDKLDKIQNTLKIEKK